MNAGYFYLVAHIVCSVSFGHILKWAIRRRRSLGAVGAVNYVVAAVAAAVLAMASGRLGLTTLALGSALLGGFGYIVSYFFYYQAIKLVGVGVSSAVTRLAVLPAVVASILIWGERPGLVQAAGILLVLITLPLLSQQRGDKSAHFVGPVWIWVLATFVTTSVGPLAAKIFEEGGTPLAKPAMLAVWFGTAAVVSVGVLRVQHAYPTRDDFPIGCVLGIVNVTATFALLAALEHLPAAIVFPVASASGVLLVIVSSAIIWHERLSRLAMAGALIAIPALVLMNLPGT